jgi:peptide/nickel transport system permease protein
MSPVATRLLQVPLTIGAAWVALVLLVPDAMGRYVPYVTRPGIACVKNRAVPAYGETLPAGACFTLSDLYGLPFLELYIDSMLRSFALLAGAAALALTVGTLLGVAAALWHRSAIVSGVIIAGTTLLAAVPAFFVAYFLQIVVVQLTALMPPGQRFLPIHGFGWDGHLILPLLSISLAAVTFTAQLTATRMLDVLAADFVTTARAKGLRTSWILAIHVLPHVRPVLLEGLGSGLRVAVASLPIVEFLFNWRGIGQLALEAAGVHDVAGFIASALILTAALSVVSAVADVSRPRALFRA